MNTPVLFAPGFRGKVASALLRVVSCVKRAHVGTVDMTITLSFKLKWWVKPLLLLLKSVNRVSGYEPDIKRLSDFIVSHGVQKFAKGKGF